MAREVQIVVACDACGARAPEDEVKLRLQQHQYTVDLCERDRSKLLQALTRFVPALREHLPDLSSDAPPEQSVRQLSPEERERRVQRARRMTAVRAGCPVEGCEREIGKNNMRAHINTHGGRTAAEVDALYAAVTAQ